MAARFRRRSVPDIWPGFVDAISTLLIIVIFLLMVFTLAQFFLSETLSGRDEALDRLNRQIAELGEILSLERNSNEDLRNDLTQISSELQGSIASNDLLAAQLGAITGRRDQLAALLEQRTLDGDRVASEIAALKIARDKDAVALEEESKRANEASVALEEESRNVDKVSRELEDAFKSIEADRGKIRTQLATLDRLRRDIMALKTVRDELETKVGKLATTLTRKDEAITALRDTSKKLEARLSTAKERTSLAQKDIENQDTRLARLRSEAEKSALELTKEQEISAKAAQQAMLLNRQIAALRQQLARISAALGASEAKALERNVQIINLGKRLNSALASKVEELARYRSEFFGKLREVLGKQKGVRVVGDRFVFQSEVLFTSGSANLAVPGTRQIRQLASTLKSISNRIPKDVDWVLRVDGHTDRSPIHTPVFASNWELSSARAIAVVKQLVALGIPPHRLAATGFGQFRPIDDGKSLSAYSRNRRIEFKLTGR
jgi:chemotaxis protein MotB